MAPGPGIGSLWVSCGLFLNYLLILPLSFLPSPLLPQALWGFLSFVVFFFFFFKLGEIILPGGCNVTEMLNSRVARGGCLI